MAEEHVAETPEVEAPAQEAVETNTPFEGEFDPDRARRTIDNLRSREKELEQQLKSDEWFQKELERRGYEVADDEDEEPFDPQDYEDSEDPLVERLSALEQAEFERRQNAVLNDLSDHVDQLAQGADLNLSDKAKQWIALESIHSGNGQPTPEGTEQAFQAMREFLDEFGKTAVDKYLKSKRAPAPPSPGTAGQPSGDFDPKDDKSRRNRMAAILNRDTA